jgi:hypothetical protein
MYKICLFRANSSARLRGLGQGVSNADLIPRCYFPPCHHDFSDFPPFADAHEFSDARESANLDSVPTSRPASVKTIPSQFAAFFYLFHRASIGDLCPRKFH